MFFMYIWVMQTFELQLNEDNHDIIEYTMTTETQIYLCEHSSDSWPNLHKFNAYF